MPVCNTHGVRFEYPEGWQLSHEHQEQDVTLHVQTTGSAFWSLTLLASRPTAKDAVAAVVAAFQDEYAEVDVYERPDFVSEGPAAGCELDFVYLDLVNTAVIRAELTSEFTALVVYQGEDREFDQWRADFERIDASLAYSGDLAAGDLTEEAQ